MTFCASFWNLSPSELPYGNTYCFCDLAFGSLAIYSRQTCPTFTPVWVVLVNLGLLLVHLRLRISQVPGIILLGCKIGFLWIFSWEHCNFYHVETSYDKTGHICHLFASSVTIWNNLFFQISVVRTNSDVAHLLAVWCPEFFQADSAWVRGFPDPSQLAHGGVLFTLSSFGPRLDSGQLSLRVSFPHPLTHSFLGWPSKKTAWLSSLSQGPLLRQLWQALNWFPSQM